MGAEGDKVMGDKGTRSRGTEEQGQAIRPLDLAVHPVKRVQQLRHQVFQVSDAPFYCYL